jgi:hypothetical protein
MTHLNQLIRNQQKDVTIPALRVPAEFAERLTAAFETLGLDPSYARGGRYLRTSSALRRPDNALSLNADQQLCALKNGRSPASRI